MKKGSRVMAKIGSGSLVAGLAMVVIYMSKLTVSADTLTSTESFGIFRYVFLAGIVFIVLAAVMFVLATITDNN